MGYLVDDAFSRGCGVVLNRGLFIRDNGVFSRGHGAYLIEGVFMRGCEVIFSRGCIY